MAVANYGGSWGRKRTNISANSSVNIDQSVDSQEPTVVKVHGLKIGKTASRTTCKKQLLLLLQENSYIARPLTQLSGQDRAVDVSSTPSGNATQLCE